MLLGLTRPDAGTVSVFGLPPEGAVDAGGVGAMLQTGSLIRDLSVRELVTMMASLYREPLAVDEALELAGRSARRRGDGRGARGGVRPADQRGPGRGSSVSTAYLRLELLRMFRNRRFFVFSLGFPIVLYYLIAGPNKNNDDLGGSGIPAPVYYMVGLVAFGTMTAVLSAGARISAERSTGWNRQLRITPLATRDYFRTKVLTGYAAAGATIAVMYIAGATLGVRLPARNWIEMTGLILVGLVPFAAAARGSRSRATGCSRRSPSSCRRTGLCRRVMSAWVAPRGGARGGSSSAPGRSG